MKVQIQLSTDDDIRYPGLSVANSKKPDIAELASCDRPQLCLCVRVWVDQLQPELWNTESFLSISNMWEQLITVSNQARNLSPSFLSIVSFLKVYR